MTCAFAFKVLRGVVSLTPLLPCAEQCRFLEIADYSIASIEEINMFTQIRQLPLFPGPRARGHLNLAHLPHLQQLAARGDLSIRLLGSPLRELFLESPREELCQQVEQLEEVMDLRLINPRIIPQALQAKSLCRLELAGCTIPRSLRIKGISGAEHLVLVRVKGISSLETFGEIANLRHLTIDNCPEIESLDGVSLAEGCVVRVIGRSVMRRNQAPD